jgi:hypothetical protein
VCRGVGYPLRARIVVVSGGWLPFGWLAACCFVLLRPFACKSSNPFCHQMASRFECEGFKNVNIDGFFMHIFPFALFPVGALSLLWRTKAGGQ